jgi:hypothetical protein
VYLPDTVAIAETDSKIRTAIRAKSTVEDPLLGTGPRRQRWELILRRMRYRRSPVRLVWEIPASPSKCGYHLEDLEFLLETWQR